MHKKLLLLFVLTAAFTARCYANPAAVDSTQLQTTIDSLKSVVNQAQQPDTTDLLQIQQSKDFIPVYEDTTKLCGKKGKNKCHCHCDLTQATKGLLFKISRISATTYNGDMMNVYIFGYFSKDTSTEVEFQYVTPFSIRNVQNEKVARKAFCNLQNYRADSLGIDAGTYLRLKDVISIADEAGKAYLPTDGTFTLKMAPAKAAASTTPNKPSTAGQDSVKSDVNAIKRTVAKVVDTAGVLKQMALERWLNDSLQAAHDDSAATVATGKKVTDKTDNLSKLKNGYVSAAKPLARQQALIEAADLLAKYRAADSTGAKKRDTDAAKNAPADTTKKGATGSATNMHTFNFQRSVADIFRVSVYTDALALFGKYANGIVQTEGYLSYHPNIRPVCNTGLIFADYLRARVIYRRLDNSEGTYYMQQGRDSFDRLGLYQRSYVTTDLTLGIFAYYFKGVHVNSEHLMYLNAGYNANLVNTAFVRDTTGSHTVKDTIYSNGVVAHSVYLNMGVHFNLQKGLFIEFNSYYYWNFVSAPRLSYFNLDSVLQHPTTKNHTSSVGNLVKLEAQLAYSPGGPHQIFLRSTVTFDVDKSAYRSAYYQITFGYSVDFATLISNALGSKGGSSSAASGSSSGSAK